MDTYQSWQALKQFGTTNAGLSTGNPVVDTALMFLLGQNVASRPVPGSNQSVYDAYQVRERNLQFLQVAQRGFASNLFFQKMGGVNQQSPAFQLASMFAANPDSAINTALSPLIGGNPVRAQMGLFANLSGQAMGTFGSMNNISVPQTTEMMNELFKKVYHQETIGPALIEQERKSALETGAKVLKDKPAILSEFRDALTSKNGLANFQTDQTTRGLLAVGMENNDPSKWRAMGNDILAAMTDGVAKEKLKTAWSEAMKGSVKEGGKTLGVLAGNDLTTLVTAGNKYLHIKDAEGTTRPKAINFDYTRGFKLEDITDFFTGAADHRLMGKGSVERNYAQFLDNAPDVMDASRSLFGNNKTGSELSKELSNLLGSSFYDLSDSKSSRELETLLRNVKAAARTAGISVDAIMGIIQQGNDLAHMHSGLQLLGGATTSNMAVRSVNQAAAVSAYFGNDYMRRAGGNVGVTQALMSGQINSAGEPISNYLYALDDLMVTKGNDIGRELIKAYAQDKGDSSHTRVGYNQFVNQLGQVTGVSPQYLNSYASTAKLAAQRGANRNPELGNVGYLAYRAELMQAARVQSPETAAELFLFLRGQDVDMDKYMAEGASPQEKEEIQKALGATPLTDYFKLPLSKRKNPAANTKIAALRANVVTRLALETGLNPFLPVGVEAQDVDMDKYMAEGASPQEKEEIQKALGATPLTDYFKLPLSKRKNPAANTKIAALRANVVTRLALETGLNRFLQSSSRSPDGLQSLLGIPGPTMNAFLAKGQDNGYNLRMMIDANPVLSGLVNTQEKTMQISRQSEEFLSKKLGYLNAPMLTTMFNKVLNGDVAKGGLVEFFAPLTTDDNTTELINTANRLHKLSMVTDHASFVTHLSEISNIPASEVKDRQEVMGLFETSGLTAEQIRKYGEKGTKGEEFLAEAANRKPNDPVLASAAKLRGSGELQRLRNLLITLDPKGEIKGKVSISQLKDTAGKRYIENFRDSQLLPLIDKQETIFSTGFDDMVKGLKNSSSQTAVADRKLGTDMQSVWDMVKSMNGGQLTAETYLEKMQDPKVKGAIAAMGTAIDPRAVELITKQATDTKGSIDKIRDAGKEAAKPPAAQTNVLLKKILDVLGKEGSKSLIETLTDIGAVISEASK